jgi:phosphate butyryltransferase
MPTTPDRPADFARLLDLAHAKTSDNKPRAALIVPSETATLPAFLKAATEGLIDPTIIGDESLLRDTASEADLNTPGLKIIDINQPDMAVKTAIKMTEADELDLLVQGRVDSDTLVACLIEGDAKFVARRQVMSHVGFIKPVKYPRLLMITDGMVHPEPDLAAKIAILRNLAAVAEACSLANPKTAVVTAVEAIYPQMPATTDGAVLAKMYERGQIKGLVVDGPLSFDIAIDSEAATAKGITGSAVAGQAEAMLCSSKQVAQAVYQSMSLFGNSELGSVLVGGRVPVATSWLTDSEQSRFNSIMLAALLA